MSPDRKAEQIKIHFKIQMQVESEKLIIAASRAYIGKIIEDFYLEGGDYTSNYEYQWHNYTSYWYEVLKYI